jgi:phosphatidylcholine synthase
LRQLNLALLAVWAGLALWALWRDMAPAGWVTAGLCAIGLYVLVAGFLRRPDESPSRTE